MTGVTWVTGVTLVTGVTGVTKVTGVTGETGKKVVQEILAQNMLYIVRVSRT